MSQSSSRPPGQTAGSNSLPGWIVSGVLGLALGAAGGVLGTHAYTTRSDNAAEIPAVDTAAAGAPGTMPAGGMPGMGGGGPPMMGGGGMGGMMGGGGFGGGGGAKFALTSLVGKLELLSRPDLTLHVELTPEQAKTIAAKLEEFDKAEKMTADEAQEAADALEALLTPEQKQVVDSIGLPRGGRGGGGGGRGAVGRPGGGPPGAGGPPGGGPPGGGPPGAGGPPGGGPPPGMMGGRGGGNPDENPFTQEANQKRLRDLLARLSPASAEKSP